MAHFGRPAAEVGRDDLRQWVDELKASSSSKRHAVLCAILFLYRKTLGLPELVSLEFPKQGPPRWQRFWTAPLACVLMLTWYDTCRE
jgi:hypothetical protein